MRVLGIDPGLAKVGYGVVEKTRSGVRAVCHGVIRTPKEDDVATRLAALYEECRELIELHDPQAVAVERVFFNANVRTAMSVAQGAGVALLTGAQAGCEVAEYTPNDVKMAVAGDGRADKRGVQEMVAVLLQLAEPPRPADAADALGLAMTHLHARRLRALAKEAIGPA